MGVDMVNRKDAKVTLQNFEIFDERAAQGLDVARAIDHEKPIPNSVTKMAVLAYLGFS
jgi:hypothetical protein